MHVTIYVYKILPHIRRFREDILKWRIMQTFISGNNNKENATRNIPKPFKARLLFVAMKPNWS